MKAKQTHLSVKRIAAASVHIFTGLGSVLGLLALLAAADGAWERAFMWLGIALVVDGADGPLARMVQVEKVLPRFSGKDLDNVVDYLNYTAVPAFMVARAEIVPEGLRTASASIIMLVSLYHFADIHSKTADGYFVGFPAIWNVVVLYCFVLGLPQEASFLLIAVCALLTFVPFYWVHPFRRPPVAAVLRWRHWCMERGSGRVHRAWLPRCILGARRVCCRSRIFHRHRPERQK